MALKEPGYRDLSFQETSNQPKRFRESGIRKSPWLPGGIDNHSVRKLSIIFPLNCG